MLPCTYVKTLDDFLMAVEFFQVDTWKSGKKVWDYQPEFPVMIYLNNNKLAYGSVHSFDVGENTGYITMENIIKANKITRILS